MLERFVPFFVDATFEMLDAGLQGMRPGQVTLNEFERALLDRIGQSEPRLDGRWADLHVLSREFTGAGTGGLRSRFEAKVRYLSAEACTGEW